MAVPPQPPMAKPPSPYEMLWAFLCEVFFNRKKIANYIRRNRAVLFLLIGNFLLFIMLLFVTEQAIHFQVLADKRQNQIFGMNSELLDLRSKEQEKTNDRRDLAMCNDRYSFAQEDYRKLSQSLEECLSKQARPVNRPAPVVETTPRRVTRVYKPSRQSSTSTDTSGADRLRQLLNNR